MPNVQGERAYAAVRALLIGYGITFAAFISPAQPAYGLWGIGVQALVTILRRFVKQEHAFLLEVLADGVTVLLFALGTFQALRQVTTDIS